LHVFLTSRLNIHRPPLLTPALLIFLPSHPPPERNGHQPTCGNLQRLEAHSRYLHLTLFDSLDVNIHNRRQRHDHGQCLGRSAIAASNHVDLRQPQHRSSKADSRPREVQRQADEDRKEDIGRLDSCKGTRGKGLVERLPHERQEGERVDAHDTPLDEELLRRAWKHPLHCLSRGHGQEQRKTQLHEDTAVDSGVIAASREHGAVPCARGKVHLQDDGREERAQELADDGLHDGERGVAACLPCHDHVARHGCRRAADEQEADEEPGVHEVAVRRADAYDGEGGGGADEVALELDEGVDFPPHVVFYQDACLKCAAVDEEDDRNGEVCDYGAFGLLAGRRDLDLRREEDNGSHGEQEPLVFDKPFQGLNGFGALRFWFIRHGRLHGRLCLHRGVVRPRCLDTFLGTHLLHVYGIPRRLLRSCSHL
jgi:hypothetical protein